MRESFSSLTMREGKGAAKSVESIETQNIIFVISEVIDFTGVIIIALGAVTWISTHKLDPYRPLDRAFTWCDYGCGNGYVLSRYARRGALVAGVDVAESAVKLAVRRFELHRDVPLSSRGGVIRLVDTDGQEVAGVSYTRHEVRRKHGSLTF